MIRTVQAALDLRHAGRGSAIHRHPYDIDVLSPANPLESVVEVLNDQVMRVLRPAQGAGCL